MMKTVYVIGPYRGERDSPWGRERNTHNAVIATRQLLKEGFAAVDPRTMYHNLDGPDLDNDLILEALIAIMSACDACVVLPGSDKSEGCQKEIFVANVAKIPVVHWTHDLTAEVVAMRLHSALGTDLFGVDE